MTKKRLVLVDDDAFWLQLLGRQLEAAGYAVDSFLHAGEAIDAIDSTHEVIIMDMLLGYNTVLPLLHEIQTDREIAKIPVIVCTNIADTMPQDALKEYGVREVIDKTAMKPGDIEAAIKRVIA